MTHRRKSRFLGIVVGLAAIAALQLGGVGGCSSAADDDEGTGLGGATAVTGTCLAANGTDPIAGATIFIPGTAVASLTSGKSIVNATCSGETVSCDDPPETSCASVCSCADGSYTLDVTTCADDSTSIRYCKGSFCGSATLDCAADSASCTANITGSTTAGSTARIAVVAGSYDEIENVLAKLGFGDVDEGGQLVPGTESFTLYDSGSGPDSSELFASLEAMQEYDIIFINCGATEDPVAALALKATVDQYGKEAAHALYHQKGFKAVSADLASRIRDYVEAGGVLYVTDLAYDYVEQSVPEFMDFEDGGDDDATTAETEGAAEEGTAGIVSDATVNNATMADWLDGITSNTIDSAESPGDSCDTTENGSTSSLLDGTDDGVRIGDFLSGWGVMRQVYAGDTDTFVWIEGPVDFTGAADEVRPLTASRAVGEGCILYSSYHTSHSCPTTGFWPQERVLQYLIFETAGACTP